MGGWGRWREGGEWEEGRVKGEELRSGKRQKGEGKCTSRGKRREGLGEERMGRQ